MRALRLTKELMDPEKTVVESTTESYNLFQEKLHTPGVLDELSYIFQERLVGQFETNAKRLGVKPPSSTQQREDILRVLRNADPRLFSELRDGNITLA